jgi:hypothetical protein
MSKPNTTSAVANVRQGPPVRVKVFGADGKIAKVHPPDGEHKGWWLRLNKALGTRSHDFVNASKDEIEGALAVQMACTHTAAMAVLAKLDVAFATEQRIAAFGSAAARLMKAYAMQMEVLRRLRTGGQQTVRVEHVHGNRGGQAVIGNVKKEDA